jgi:hypothetical protein
MVLPAAGVLALACHFLFQAGDEPIKEEAPAVAAARARQQSVKTADIEFKQREIIPRGGKSDENPDLYGPKAPVPANETTCESINRLVFDGEKYRYEDNHPTWGTFHVPNPQTIKWSSISAFDGTTAKHFFERGIGFGNRSGSIGQDPQVWTARPFSLDPITMAFRGLNSDLSWRVIPAMKPSGNTLPIDWAPCQEYVINVTKSDQTFNFWLDPDKDYVVRRISHQSPGRLFAQTNIRYRRDDACGWVPDSWVRNEYSAAGKVSSTTRVDVVAMRLNEPQPAELFDVQFPPGTMVADQRNHKEYRVQPDGSLRELSRVTGQELPVSEGQPEGAWYWRYKWLLAGSGVVLAGLAWQYAVRRKRANAA